MYRYIFEISPSSFKRKPNFTCCLAFSITISENSPVFANRHNTGTVGIQVFAKVLTPKAFQFYRVGGTEDLTGQKRLKKSDKKSEHEMFDSLILFFGRPATKWTGIKPWRSVDCQVLLKRFGES